MGANKKNTRQIALPSGIFMVPTVIADMRAAIRRSPGQRRVECGHVDTIKRWASFEEGRCPRQGEETCCGRAHGRIPLHGQGLSRALGGRTQQIAGRVELPRGFNETDNL